MKGMKKEGVFAWNARADEVIKCGPPVNKERADLIRATHPLMTSADIEEILKEYHGRK